MLVLQDQEWLPIWKKCSYAHRQVEEQPCKMSQKNGDKSAVAMLKITRQLGCVFQDMEPPKSSSILRKSSDILKPIQCVKFTKNVATSRRHSRTPILRSEWFPTVILISVSRMLQNLRIGLRKTQSGKRQGTREAAWRLAKSVLKLKEKNKAAFFSLSENGCLPASNLKPEEREFVVDSGASMHMISKKDSNSAEMDTLTKSCSPTIVMTANGEVQTHEEATVYVKELDIFLALKVLENTPAVLSLGKLCDEKNGCSYAWINGQKPLLIKNGIRIHCNTDNFVPIGVPGLSSSSSSSSHSSTSMTPSRQERNHPTSSSSSSTSPTTTVLCDSETQEREDLSKIDSHPAICVKFTCWR